MGETIFGVSPSWTAFRPPPPATPKGSVHDRQQEVDGAQWVPTADIAELDTPAEFPALVADAAQWAKARR
jgi:hypothetical protein